MQLIETAFSQPAVSLAADEALLEHACQTGRQTDLLRLWEFAEPTVVLGRSSQVALEIDLEACRRGGVAVLRRTSGGCAIVAGPGCLMYTLLLGVKRHPQLAAIDQAHAWVLERLSQALVQAGADVRRAGTSDLAFESAGALLKCSGNSLRLKQGYVLYHGTVLYDFPRELIERCLRQPPREPDYRGQRTHREFVENLPLPRAQIRAALIGAFAAREPGRMAPRALVHNLVAEKYSRDEWNLRH